MVERLHSLGAGLLVWSRTCSFHCLSKWHGCPWKAHLLGDLMLWYSEPLLHEALPWVCSFLLPFMEDFCHFLSTPCKCLDCGYLWENDLHTHRQAAYPSLHPSIYLLVVLWTQTSSGLLPCSFALCLKAALMTFKLSWVTGTDMGNWVLCHP